MHLLADPACAFCGVVLALLIAFTLTRMVPIALEYLD